MHGKTDSRESSGFFIKLNFKIMVNSKKYDLIFKLVKTLKKEEASIAELETLSSKMVLQGNSFKLKLNYSIEQETDEAFIEKGETFRFEYKDPKTGIAEQAQAYQWDPDGLFKLYSTAWRAAGCSSSAEEDSLNTAVGLHSAAAILEIVLSEKKRNRQDLLRALEALGVDINN